MAAQGGFKGVKERFSSGDTEATVTVTSWYDSGLRLDATGIVAPTATVPVKIAPVTVGIITPMPPPGFVWGIDTFEDEVAVVSTPAPAAAPAPPAPAAPAACAEEMLTVAQAAAFLADPLIAGTSTADKKAYLEAKGASAFVIAQAECVAPEDNVQGHPEPPAPALVVESTASPAEWPMMGGVNKAYKTMPSGGAPACIFAPPAATADAVFSWYDAGLRLPSGPDAAFAEARAAAALAGGGRLLTAAQAKIYLAGANARNSLLAAGVPLDVIRAAEAVITEAASSAVPTVWPMLGGVNKAYKVKAAGGAPPCIFA